jgi:MraZ protein
MINLLGEYDCKLDSKGRLAMPSGLKKQLEEHLHKGFVMNRDIFEKCLVLYPNEEWEKVSGQLGRLNRFVRKNALFIRRFNNGATPVQIDNSGRILLPKSLTGYAGIKKDVKVCGNGERIELWDKNTYSKMLDEDIDFGALSEEVMGDNPPSDE